MEEGMCTMQRGRARQDLGVPKSLYEAVRNLGMPKKW